MGIQGIQKLARNDPCRCGSGKKYKHCCRQTELATEGKMPSALLPSPLPFSVDQAIDSAIGHHQAGRLSEANALYQKVLEIDPHQPDALHLSGTIAHHQSQHELAVSLISKAIRQQASGSMWNNLGLALRALGKLDEAVLSYRRALELEPGRFQTHNNLGNALNRQGRVEEAIQSFQQALTLKPDFVDAWYNLAGAQQQWGMREAAVASYGSALQLQPDHVAAINNLGNVLRDLGWYYEAVECLQRAIELHPTCVNAYSSLGVALSDLGQFDAAVKSCRQALDLAPDFSTGWSNLCTSWSNLLCTLNYVSGLPPEQMLAEARHFGEVVADHAHPYSSWQNTPDPERCLRVGIVSSDLRNHPVGYFAEGLFAALARHAHGRIELVMYNNGDRADALTARIKAASHAWHDVMNVTDEPLAKMIHDDCIDILVDLSGHTANNRLSLFAWKPAPVQASWLGYFATTGVAAIDYFIADSWMAPPAADAQFTERIVRLPETFLCFTPPEIACPVNALPASDKGYIIFGCFNNLSKVNDAVIACWASILHAIPASCLFLKNKQLDEARTRQSILAKFAIHGIDNARLLLEGISPRAEYFSAYHRVDIALDPFPYPGGTTSIEGLWMGVPVLTLSGESYLSHQGQSILHNVGLSDWIAHDENDYIARAVAHAGDLPNLAVLRSRLRQQLLASPICDAPRFARHFEAALRQMWTTWCAQKERADCSDPMT